MNYEYDPTFEQEPKQENAAAGVLGALLGSLAGVVCIILLSQLNFVASISGLVMAVCALKGYEKLAGTLSKKGAVISGVVILIMTYLAHHLDITIELMREAGMSFSAAFVSIPRLLRYGMLNQGVFWGNLALLYLFTLLGALPTIRNSTIKPLPQYFPEQNTPDGVIQPGPAGNIPAAGAGGVPAGGIPTSGAGNAQPALGESAGTPAAPAQEGQAQAPQANIEFYPPDRHMTAKPRYGGLGLALFYFVTGFVSFVVGCATDSPYITPILGGIVLFVCAFFPYLSAFMYVPDTMILYARMNGTLWRINLEQLNKQPGYHFTNSHITLTGVRWHKLSPEEQQRAKMSVQYLITAIETSRVESMQMESTRGNPFGSFDMLIAMPLAEAVVLKETRWGWKISYVANNGKRRKLTIHKSYPGFSPAPGYQPSERPVPFPWRSTIVSLAIALLFIGLFIAVDITQASRSRPKENDRPRMSASEPDTYSTASPSAGDSVPETDAPDADAPGRDTRPGTLEITPDNYQLLFHLAKEYGYETLGVGYLPVPAETFGENMYVEAFVPYCDAPVYSEDGGTITAAAHGMQVDVTILPSEGDARDAVEVMYDAFAASGADLYEDGIFETEFNEEYGIAVKQVFYFEENGTLLRMCLFYADEPVNGHCYTARITYLLEQPDEDYPALVQELSDAFGLNLPEIDPLEP